MAFQTIQVQPEDAIEDFAQVYGCRPEDFLGSLQQIEEVRKATGVDGSTIGVLGWRISPQHGAEIMGGVLKTEARQAAATALLNACLAKQPRAYAYADEAYWPLSALEQAGLKPYRAYTRSSGPLPGLPACVPEGFRVVPLTEVSDLGQRWAAQEGWSDLIGHTRITEEAIAPGAFGSDETLGCMALDTEGTAVGVCRVWRSGDEISLTTPAVRPEARPYGLRKSMLAWVCRNAHERGLKRMVLEAWGDSEADRSEDQALGLILEILVPIYASGH